MTTAEREMSLQKRKIRNGSRTVPDVLAADIPEWLKRMPTSDLVECVPHLPRKKLHEFLYTAQLSPIRSIEDTQLRQRNLLVELVREWEEKRRNGKRARPHRTTSGLRRSKGGQL